MMVRERWAVVAVLGIALGVTAGLAAAQSAAHKPRVVQPAQDAPPDQAQQPDLSSDVPSAPREQFEQPPDPPPPTDPPPVAQEETPSPTSVDLPPIPEAVAHQTPPAPPETPVVPAKTPEGRHLQSETAALLALARDLKSEIEKAGTNTLSLAALRKAEEIQKMSKTLRDEMNKEEQVVQGK